MYVNIKQIYQLCFLYRKPLEETWLFANELDIIWSRRPSIFKAKQPTKYHFQQGTINI